MNEPYDLIVIGSGTAAQVAIARVRKRGWRVAVIDHRPFGGTCALRGCDPKKMLVSGEEAIDAARRMKSHGLDGEVRIDWPSLMAFKHSFTDPIPAKQARHYSDLGVDAYQGPDRGPLHNVIPASTLACFYSAPLAWNPTAVDMRSVLQLGSGLAARSANSSVVLALPGSFQGASGALGGGGGDRVTPTLTVARATSVSVLVARDLDFTDVEEGH